MFAGLNQENWKAFMTRVEFSLTEALYMVKLKNMSGYMESCHYCTDKRCDGCPLPFVEDITVKDYLDRLNIESNVSFYADGYKKGKQDMIFDIIWNNKIEKSFFDSF